MSRVVFETATEYGPITRLWMGPIPLLMTNEPKIIQELLTNANALEKAWLMKVMTRTMVGNAIIISEGKILKTQFNQMLIFAPLLIFFCLF